MRAPLSVEFVEGELWKKSWMGTLNGNLEWEPRMGTSNKNLKWEPKMGTLNGNLVKNLPTQIMETKEENRMTNENILAP